MKLYSRSFQMIGASVVVVRMLRAYYPCSNAHVKMWLRSYIRPLRYMFACVRRPRRIVRVHPGLRLMLKDHDVPPAQVFLQSNRLGSPILCFALPKRYYNNSVPLRTPLDTIHHLHVTKLYPIF